LFTFVSIQDYHLQLVHGRQTCVQAVTHYIREIQLQNHLNAFIETFKDEALARASELDAEIKEGKPLRKLHGVVIGIKDNICYKDHFISAGSNILRHFKSLYSATVIERILAEGAIIIGRQNCDEFAMGNRNENPVYGPVKNQLDNTRISGGSSGGSAVAVQASLCMASLGSDTGGSVRQPADHCGVIGFKPSYGMISRHGLIAYASSFDQIGIIANNIDDIEKIFHILSGEDGFDSTVLPNVRTDSAIETKPVKSTSKIAWLPETLHHTSLDPEIKTGLKNTLESLQKEGHLVEAVPFPLIDFIVPAYYILTTAEASSNLSRYDGVRYGYRKAMQTSDLFDFYAKNRSEGFGWEVKKRIMLGTFVLSAGYFDQYFKKAQQVRKLIIQLSEKIFQQYDFILLPTVPQVPDRIGTSGESSTSGYLSDIYTVFANLAGIPAISLPIYKHTSGMVFGIQAMSSQKNDIPLLRFSETLLKKH